MGTPLKEIGIAAKLEEQEALYIKNAATSWY
jgi:hypothetical protein